MIHYVLNSFFDISRWGVYTQRSRVERATISNYCIMYMIHYVSLDFLNKRFKSNKQFKQ